MSKIFKTQRDKDVMTAHHIKTTFGLDLLNEKFLKTITHLSQVDKFHHSLIYFANREYRDSYIDKYKDTEMIDQIMITFRQEEMIKKIVKLFFKDGLLDQRTIKVYSRSDSLTNEQQLFISNNFNKIKKMFDGLKKKTKPKNSFKLLKLGASMVKEFFGGFLLIDISKRIHGIDDTWYRKGTINFKNYFELMLNKNIKILEESKLNHIKTIFNKSLCNFGKLHGNFNFRELIENTDKTEYLFY
jgi:hypothetical protein